MKYQFSYYQQRIRIRKREEVLTDKFLDLANLAGAGMIFGQFISPEVFRIPIFIVGFLIVIVMYLYAWYYLSRFN